MQFMQYHKQFISLTILVWIITALSLVQVSTTLAQDEPGHIRRVRSIETKELNITRPAGLAYSPREKAFHVLSERMSNQLVPSNADLFLLTPTEKSRGSVRIAAQVKDPINMTFDDKHGRLLILKTPANQLIEVLAGSEGRLDPRTLSRHNVKRFGLDHPQGMTVDSASGHLFILDATGPVIVRVEPGPDGSFDNAGVSKLELPEEAVNPRGLAWDPTTGSLHVLSPATLQLFELTEAGQIVAVRDLSEFSIRNPQAMVFAPSGDMTDDAGQMSLYIADSGQDTQQVRRSQVSALTRTQPDTANAPGNQLHLPLIVGGADVAITVRSANATTRSTEPPGQIVELSLIQPAAVEAASQVATVVQTIDTSQFSPPSPDPAGIVYLASSNTLLVSDSEVNEISALFTGDNLFDMTLSGVLNDTLTTIPFSNEPTGVTFDSADNGRLFFSDDNAKVFIEAGLGNDKLYGTADDPPVTTIDTEAFNSFDPEGLTFDPTQGVLYLADGMNNEVYRVAPGPNGVFDGSDDVVTHFDTAILGITNPEGIAFDTVNQHLYITGDPRTVVAQVTTGGTLVRIIDSSAANALNPAGLAYVGEDADITAYMTDRGVDNDSDPNENDGKVYELSFSTITPGNTPPTVDAGPDQTITLPASATLDGTLVSDDGVPIAAVTTWTQAGGPGLVTFVNSNAEDTKASFTLPGTYVLRLTASDGELTASDELTVVVNGVPQVLLTEIRVNASFDDTEERENGTTIPLTNFDLELVDDFVNGVVDNQTVGMRFNAVDIPRGATIVHAYVQFKVDEIDFTPTSLTVQGEATDNAATFNASPNNVSGRPRTTTAVSWSPPPWTTVGESGFDQRTTKIAAVIQEIVNRSGWSSGNSLAIIVTGSGTRTAESYDGDQAGAPFLHVEWLPPGHVTLRKLTNGLENQTMVWGFRLAGLGVDEADSSPPAIVDFGGANLHAGKEYALCETGIPAGWTLEWQADTNGDLVPDSIIPIVAGVNDDPADPLRGYSRVYDPNFVPPPDTFTNDTRCVNIVVDPGETLALQVDNRFPGGEPRTVGYWKNWNSCTGGNQAQTAANNGGPDEGWFILDDILNSPGVTIGVLQLDGDDCEDAVELLDKRDVRSGKKMANDAAYKLASQLLAAQSNLSVGAETCQAAVDAVNAGQFLLNSIGFTGTGTFLRPKDRQFYRRAIALAETLDMYNVGNLCAP